MAGKNALFTCESAKGRVLACVCGFGANTKKCWGHGQLEHYCNAFSVIDRRWKATNIKQAKIVKPRVATPKIQDLAPWKRGRRLHLPHHTEPFEPFNYPQCTIDRTYFRFCCNVRVYLLGACSPLPAAHSKLTDTGCHLKRSHTHTHSPSDHKKKTLTHVAQPPVSVVVTAYCMSFCDYHVNTCSPHIHCVTTVLLTCTTYSRRKMMLPDSVGIIRYFHSRHGQEEQSLLQIACFPGPYPPYRTSTPLSPPASMVA